jgi:uncharacterized surface protein with fasciclin (FAS1) repeats/uncharacterized membrane protein YuzA (DUF378 family)
MKRIDVLAAVLLVVGGLNWGLVALGKFDLVAFLTGAGQFGERNAIGALIYGLVGASALYQIFSWKAIQRRWAHASVITIIVAALVGLGQPALASSCGGDKHDHGVKASAASTTTEAQASATGNILEVAAGAGQFQTLAAAIQAAGLSETLSGKGPFTVFAPTDAAFAKLPKGTVEALLQDKEKLAKILTYHVVPGKLMAADVVKLKDASTVQGQKVKFSTSKDGVKINDAKILSTDVAANNGVIHVIDTVILPS